MSILSYYFADGTACCLTNMDGNGDGSINIADAVAILSYYFADGNLTGPGGAAVETPGCINYDESAVAAEVLPCDSPCEQGFTP